MLVASLSHLLKSGTLCLQLCWHFPPAPQDSLLPASRFMPLSTSVLESLTWHLLPLFASTDFVYLLTQTLHGRLVVQNDVRQVHYKSNKRSLSFDQQGTFLSSHSSATYRCGTHLCFLVLSRQWANTQCYGWQTTPLQWPAVSFPVSYTHLTLPTNREV